MVFFFFSSSHNAAPFPSPLASSLLSLAVVPLAALLGSLSFPAGPQQWANSWRRRGHGRGGHWQSPRWITMLGIETQGGESGGQKAGPLLNITEGARERGRKREGREGQWQMRLSLSPHVCLKKKLIPSYKPKDFLRLSAVNCPAAAYLGTLKWQRRSDYRCKHPRPPSHVTISREESQLTENLSRPLKSKKSLRCFFFPQGEDAKQTT